MRDRGRRVRGGSGCQRCCRLATPRREIWDAVPALSRLAWCRQDSLLPGEPLRCRRLQPLLLLARLLFWGTLPPPTRRPPQHVGHPLRTPRLPPDHVEQPDGCGEEDGVTPPRVPLAAGAAPAAGLQPGRTLRSNRPPTLAWRGFPSGVPPAEAAGAMDLWGVAQGPRFPGR